MPEPKHLFLLEIEGLDHDQGVDLYRRLRQVADAFVDDRGAGAFNLTMATVDREYGTERY